MYLSPFCVVSHQSVGIGHYVSGKIRIDEAFSFGEDGTRQWYGLKRTWLGWSGFSPSAPSYSPEGVIYPTDGTGAIMADKPVTRLQGLSWLNWMTGKRVGTHDFYFVDDFNCRTYSQKEYDQEE